MGFFNLCDDKGWGDGEFDLHCDPLGSPGTPLVGLVRGIPGLNIGDGQHTTHALGRKRAP